MHLVSAYTDYAYIYARDVRAVGYVARPWYRGRWELRPTVGLGFMQSTGAVYDGSMTFGVEGAFVTLEGSFLINRDLGKSWAVYAGPLATVMMQKYDSDGVTPMVIRNNLDFVMFAGLRRRL
jgi:hypothetical protein